MSAATDHAAVREELAFALDPARLMAAGGTPPDAWQARFLRAVVGQDSRTMLVLASRQSGKTTVFGAAAAHVARFQSGSLVGIVSPTQRQSSEAFRVAKRYLHVGTTQPNIVRESELQLELASGSRIVSVPAGESARGLAGVKLLIADEASRIEDAALAVMTPMLAASRGRLVAGTTPRGAMGWFYGLWNEMSDEIVRTKVTAYECSRFTKEFLEREHRVLGPRAFAEEYLAEWGSLEDSAFSLPLIEEAARQEWAKRPPLACYAGDAGGVTT